MVLRVALTGLVSLPVLTSTVEYADFIAFQPGGLYGSAVFLRNDTFVVAAPAIDRVRVTKGGGGGLLIGLERHF